MSGNDGNGGDDRERLPAASMSVTSVLYMKDGVSIVTAGEVDSRFPVRMDVATCSSSNYGQNDTNIKKTNSRLPFLNLNLNMLPDCRPAAKRGVSY
ncbi:hypothetical protein M8C21_020278 [Ambrosia artemisiifolia]|uniref:Uncharacterized protein n=1 Tax=Ambrosia artemisiifolia TaxID=4212 RepID=A0AAD5D2V9_AMBAR|nr:hypothetical protein M8C21_020278 [Ambrosia artemisiifolia]